MNTIAMTVSEAQGWGILIASIVGAIAALAGTLVSTVNSLRLSRTETKVDAQGVKQDDQVQKIHDIGISTDGAMSIAKDALKISNERVVQLEEFIKKTDGGNVPETTKQTAPRDPPPPPSIVAAETPPIAPPVPPIVQMPPVPPKPPL